MTTRGNAFNPGPNYGGSPFAIQVANAGGGGTEVMWVTNVTVGGGDPRNAGGGTYIGAGTTVTVTVVRGIDGSGLLSGVTGYGSIGAWVCNSQQTWSDLVHPNNDGAAVIAAAYQTALRAIPSANTAIGNAQGASTWVNGRSMPVNGVINGGRLYVNGAGKTSTTLVAMAEFLGLYTDPIVGYVDYG